MQRQCKNCKKQTYYKNKMVRNDERGKSGIVKYSQKLIMQIGQNHFCGCVRE